MDPMPSYHIKHLFRMSCWFDPWVFSSPELPCPVTRRLLATPEPGCDTWGFPGTSVLLGARSPAQNPLSAKPAHRGPELWHVKVDVNLATFFSSFPGRGAKSEGGREGGHTETMESEDPGESCFNQVQRLPSPPIKGPPSASLLPPNLPACLPLYSSWKYIRSSQSPPPSRSPITYPSPQMTLINIACLSQTFSLRTWQHTVSLFSVV